MPLRDGNAHAGRLLKRQSATPKRSRRGVGADGLRQRASRNAHLVAEHADGGGGGELRLAEPDGGHARGQPEDEELRARAHHLRAHQHREPPARHRRALERRSQCVKRRACDTREFTFRVRTKCDTLNDRHTLGICIGTGTCTAHFYCKDISCKACKVLEIEKRSDISAAQADTSRGFVLRITILVEALVFTGNKQYRGSKSKISWIKVKLRIL